MIIKGFLVFLISNLAWAQGPSIDYGFLNQDQDNRICFVGIDRDDLQYSGAVSLDSLDEESLATAMDCQDLKVQGVSAVIQLTSTSEKSWNPIDKVIIYQVKRKLSCLVNPPFAFDAFTKVWRESVENSNFRVCPE